MNVLGGDVDAIPLHAGGLLAQPLAHDGHMGVEAVTCHLVIQGQPGELDLLPAGSQAGTSGNQPYRTPLNSLPQGGCPSHPRGAEHPLPSSDMPTDKLPVQGPLPGTNLAPRK